MTAGDLAAIVRGMMPVIRECASRIAAERTEPLLTRVAALEVRPVPASRDGRDADPAQILELKAQISELRAALLSRHERSTTGDDLAPLISAEVTKAFVALPHPWDDAPGRWEIEAMVSAQVTKAVAALPTPKDGKSLTTADVMPLIAAEVARAVSALAPPKDGAPGKPPEPSEIEAMVVRAVAALPAARDGIDLSAALIDRAGHLVLTLSNGAMKDVGLVAGRDAAPADVEAMVSASVVKAVAALHRSGDDQSVDIEALIAAEVTRAMSAMPRPKDGKSFTRDDVAPLIVAAVTEAVSALPVPKDGRSLTPDEVAPLIAEEVRRAVSDLPTPKDGVGLLAALIDRNGHLVLTLSDGVTKDLGVVVGRDVDMADLARLVSLEVAKIPRPKDGADGEDGRDGTLENLKIVQGADLRTITFCFKDTGDPIEGGCFRSLATIYRGIFDASRTYEAGDQVTCAGSMWIAKTTTNRRPDEDGPGARDWTLSAKRGQPGKTGPEGKPGQKGADGPPGRDLTQMDEKGRKW